MRVKLATISVYVEVDSYDEVDALMEASEDTIETGIEMLRRNLKAVDARIDVDED